MIIIELKKVEEGIIPIYENETKDKLINARELHEKLKNNTKFADWIKRKIEHYKFEENEDYICFLNFEKANKYGNKTTKEYYITVDMAKELCMVENNETGRKIRRYCIEYWQVYFKPKAVEEIQKWFNENKEEIYYEIQYVRNTKHGNKKGEIKERGYKIENVCYKVDYLKNKQQ